VAGIVNAVPKVVGFITLGTALPPPGFEIKLGLALSPMRIRLDR
jgi:hypothetical protein